MINRIEKALGEVLTSLTRPFKKSLKVPGSLLMDDALVLIWICCHEEKQTSQASTNAQDSITKWSAHLMAGS